MKSKYLQEQLIRHEGLRLKPYYCPAGHLTIGVGRNLEAKGITRAEAMTMLDNDIQAASDDVKAILAAFDIQVWKLNRPRQDALINMAFNIGRRSLMGFKKMFAAIKAEDFEKAAVEMLDSKYAEDVRERAVELSMQLKTGRYQP